MKYTLGLVLLVMTGGFLNAQVTKETPYRGFYQLNIPGFTWKTGAEVQARYGERTGKLQVDDVRYPLFVTVTGEKIPLLLSQANRLVMLVNPGDQFTLWGIDGTSTEKEGKTERFFVALGATVRGNAVDLVPVETEKKSPAPGQDGPPGGRGGPGGGMGGGMGGPGNF